MRQHFLKIYFLEPLLEKLQNTNDHVKSSQFLLSSVFLHRRHMKMDLANEKSALKTQSYLEFMPNKMTAKHRDIFRLLRLHQLSHSYFGRGTGFEV